jgi:hypothetical protein
MLTYWTLYNYSTIHDQRGFLRFVLGRCLLTIISGILFWNKGFVQNITQRTYLVIGSGQKVDLRGNFGCFLDDICLTIFSVNLSWKTRFSNLLHQFAHVHHQIFAVIYCMPRLFGSFIPKLGDLDSRLGGCGTRVISNLFFKSAGR